MELNNINPYFRKPSLLHAHFLPPTDRDMTPTPLVLWTVGTTLTILITQAYQNLQTLQHPN